MNPPLQFSVPVLVACCMLFPSCGKDQEAPPAVNEQANAPSSAPPPLAPPAPVSSPEPAQTGTPPADSKYAGFPPHIVKELMRLEETYPELKTDIANELVRLKDYETAIRMIEGDFDAIVKALVPLVNCSKGGSELFFQKDRLAHEAADKLMLLTMLDKNVEKVFDAMEKQDAEASDEELQNLYLRMRAIEQCEGRLVRLTHTYKWREAYLMPLFETAANRASDEGQLVAIRPAAKLLKMIEQKTGLLSLYPEQEAGVFGKRKVRHKLFRGPSSSEQNEEREWRQPQPYGIRWSPEEDCRILLFDALRKKFQLDDVKLIDLAAIAAFERDTARRLKLLELWHAALSVAGEQLAKWLPPKWEQPGDEHLRGLQVLVAGAVYYEPGNPYPKAEPWNPASFIYLPEAAYAPGQFAVALEENGKAEVVRAALKKGADFPTGYSEKWTLDEFLEEGRIKPFAKHGPRPKIPTDPTAEKTTMVSLVQTARLLLDGDEKTRDPMLSAVMLITPEAEANPGANAIRERAHVRLSIEQRHLLQRLESLLKEDAR